MKGDDTKSPNEVALAILGVRTKVSGAHPEILGAVPDSWGPKRATSGGAVALTSIGPDEIAVKAPAHFVIVLFTPQPSRETALASDRVDVFTAPIGALEIMPAEVEFKARWSIPKKNALFAIKPAALVELVAAEFDMADVELQPPKPGTIDRQALNIANLMREALLNDGALNDLYIDSLVTLFSLHVLRSYSSVRGAGGSVGSRRLPHEWRRVVDFMHDHLAERISLTALAAVAGLSPSHFLHAFRSAFGRSPHKYLLDLRLAYAEKLIIETELPLAAIAEASGFSGQSHLTTTMQNYKSVTPGQLRRLKRQVDRPFQSRSGRAVV